MVTSRTSLHTALPLRPRDLFVLLVLADGDLHGYGIMKAIERESGGSVRLEVGSLYRTLARLLRGQLIEEAPIGADEPDPEDERRRYYRLSTFGRRVATAEAERLRAVVSLAAQKGLLANLGKAR